MQQGKAMDAVPFIGAWPLWGTGTAMPVHTSTMDISMDTAWIPIEYHMTMDISINADWIPYGHTQE